MQPPKKTGPVMSASNALLRAVEGAKLTQAEKLKRKMALALNKTSTYIHAYVHNRELQRYLGGLCVCERVCVHVYVRCYCACGSKFLMY